jgi:hypothetical protein
VLRKWLGYQLSPSLRFRHKVAGQQQSGKKIYYEDDFQTPYEKLKSIPDGHRYLKDDITFAMLDKIVYSKTDNEMATVVQKQRSRLFEQISPIIDSKLLQAHY